MCTSQHDSDCVLILPSTSDALLNRAQSSTQPVAQDAEGSRHAALVGEAKHVRDVEAGIR
jgi:hypothetical protein